jgi:sec-independent protein translocase protein TatB
VFNVTGSEVIILLLLALVILGPEKLPDAIRRFGRIYGELRRMGQGFQDELRDALDEPMRELRSTADMARRAIEEPADEIKDTAKGIGQTATDAFAAATKFSTAPVAGGVAKSSNQESTDPDADTTDPDAATGADAAADADAGGAGAEPTDAEPTDAVVAESGAPDSAPYETNAPGEPLEPYETNAPGEPIEAYETVSPGQPLNPDLPASTNGPLNADLPESTNDEVGAAEDTDVEESRRA